MSDSLGIVHEIPFATESATFELAVANRSADDPLDDAAVTVVSAPEWLRVHPRRVEVGTLASTAEASVTFAFEIDRAAPVGTTGEVLLEVLDGSGRALDIKTVRLAVRPPTELALDAPYPNPSWGRAVVPFALPSPGPVRVSIYDALGREVAVLADEDRDAGAHEVSIDTGGLAAGVYAIRLSSGTEARLTRLTVVR